MINDRVDDRTVVDLGRSLDAAREKLTGLRASIDDLAGLGTALARRGREYQSALADRLEQEVKEDQAALASVRLSESHGVHLSLLAHIGLDNAWVDRVDTDTVALSRTPGWPTW